MFSNHTQFMMAEHALQFPFRGTDRFGITGETRKENFVISYFPTDINGRDQIIAVRRKAFIRTVLEVLDSLVDAMDHVSPARQTPLEAGFRFVEHGLAEPVNVDGLLRRRLVGE